MGATRPASGIFSSFLPRRALRQRLTDRHVISAVSEPLFYILPYSNNKQNIANLPVTRVSHPNSTIYNIYMYEPPPPCPPAHHVSALSRSSQKKHRQNARATPIFFSDQYTIRSPVTKKPPSRNRKPRFASPQKQSTAPSATASALMFLEATRTIVRGRPPRSGLMCIL